MDISTDSRKSNNEDVLKRDYGVIRLGIGEEKIDSEESFSASSNYEDEEEKKEKQGDKADESSEAQEEGFNQEAFNLLKGLMQEGVK